MTNFNNPKGNRDNDDLPLTPKEKSYRDGFVQGRVGNEEVEHERERAAENSGAASGIVLGGIIAALLGLGAAALYYFNRPTEPVPTTIINTPVTPAATAPKPEKETKIIERTIEKAVPGPTQTKIIEKAVPGPTKVVEVDKPILVPGPTKVIKVPAAPASPVPEAPANKTDSSKPDSPTPSPSPAASPSGDAGNTPTGTNN
ncbi:MAG: hypothetical protein LH474_00220 [Chamaesiphon sp.]|nr:hypothetical protein [Chamaesiphon sp.]